MSPHKLRLLNTWSIADDSIWEGYEMSGGDFGGNGCGSLESSHPALLPV